MGMSIPADTFYHAGDVITAKVICKPHDVTTQCRLFTFNYDVNFNNDVLEYQGLEMNEMSGLFNPMTDVIKLGGGVSYTDSDWHLLERYDICTITFIVKKDTDDVGISGLCSSFSLWTEYYGVEKYGIDYADKQFSISIDVMNKNEIDTDTNTIIENDTDISISRDDDTPVTDKGKCGDNVFYELHESGTLYIYGSGDMYNYYDYTYPGNDLGFSPFYANQSITDVIIASGVTNIGNWTFYGCGNLSSIVIPDSVSDIGDFAFYICPSLTSIEIPDSVTRFGESVFRDCLGLTSIKLPDKVTSISHSMFEGCTNLNNVQIPNSVTSIEQSAFTNCSSLTNITIPESVTSIGAFAFGICINLKSIDIPDNVTDIKDDSFWYCSNLKRIDVGSNNPVYTSQNGILYDKKMTKLILCPAGKTDFEINKGITSIGNCAFANCLSLKNLKIPDGVKSIGRKAFYSCENLESITIPDSVTEIIETAFYSCTNLKDVYYSGTEEQWNKVEIGDINDYLKNANIGMVY